MINLKSGGEQYPLSSNDIGMEYQRESFLALESRLHNFRLGMDHFVRWKAEQTALVAMDSEWIFWITLADVWIKNKHCC